MSIPTQSPVIEETTPRARRYVIAALLFAVGLGAWGIVSRVAGRSALASETADLAIPTVSTVKPEPGSAAESLVLPGSVQAYTEAVILARTNGYLKAWHTDIGTRVKKGQLLAEIDTPEIDQQLRQARAELSTAQANFDLARTTDARWQKLLATDAVSRQSADATAGDAAAKKAALASAEANVARLSDLESFKRVLAPFDGVVTSRNTDIGALINSGQGNALFRVADTRRLRIYVLVPQIYAANATPGLDANVSFPERPGKTYPARVARTAEALDPSSRTLQVELLVDNESGALFPGAYAQVHFKLPRGTESLRVPANTVLFRSNLQVAVVGPDDRVNLKNIATGRDFGASLEVINGIAADDNLVVNPPDSLATGTRLRVVQLPSLSTDGAGRSMPPDHP